MRFTVRLASGIVFASALVGCAGGGSPLRTDLPGGEGSAAVNEYIIGPGDRVQIFVWRNEDISVTVPVRPDGKISTPLVEDMQAVGKTPTQLARDIEVVLEEFVRGPQVNVIVEEFVGTFGEQIRVVGQAAEPQALAYRERLTLLDVMIEVGGLTEFASGNRARVVRAENGQSREIRVRLNDLLNDGDMSQNIAMRPGDVVIIPGFVLLAMHETYRFIVNELRSAWRFRWFAMGGAWLFCVVGWLVVMILPNIYQASARVYVDANSDLKGLLGNQIVEEDVTEQLDLVRQEMLGRAELERVVVSVGLAKDASTSEERLPIVERLQREIVVSNTGTDGRPLPPPRPMPNAESPDIIYQIRYQNSDPAIALAVVDTLLNVLVEDTYSAASEGSENTRSFLEQEERDYAARLAEADNRVAQFRRDNFDRLPNAEEGYFERLQRETDELDDVRQDLDLARSRRDRINQSLRDGVPLTGFATTETSRREGGRNEPVSRSTRIQEQEARLEELLLRYTDRHPEVVAVRESLVELRRLQAEELSAMVESGAGPIDPANPVYQQLQISLNEVQVQIAELEADVTNREARVQRWRARVNEVPEVEAQLTELMRGYDVLNAQHEAIVQSLERQHLSRGAQESEGVKLVIIDPPTVGSEPVAPSRTMLMLAVLFASFGAGGVVAYLLAQLRPVFQDPHGLRDFTGLPLLGTVSLASRPGSIHFRRLDVASFVAAGLALIGVFGALLLIDVGSAVRSLIGTAV